MSGYFTELETKNCLILDESKINNSTRARYLKIKQNLNDH